MKDCLQLLDQEARTLKGLLDLYRTSHRAEREERIPFTDLEVEIGHLVLRERFGVAVPLEYIDRIYSQAAKGLYALRRAEVLVAMPGLGKTSLATGDTRYADMDYGNWRRRWAASKSALSPQVYARILGIFVLRVLSDPENWDKRVIFVNEVDLIPLFKSLGLGVKVLLPDEEFIPRWLAGLTRRTVMQAVEKLEVGMEVLSRFEFCLRAIESHRKWLIDWQSAAAYYESPCYAVSSWLNDIPWVDVSTPSNDPALSRATAGKEKYNVS